MKILYLISSMYNSAGMERSVANKANYLTDHGHEVTIVTTDQGDKDYFYMINSHVKKYDLGLNFSNDDNKNIIYRTFGFFEKNRLFKYRLNEYLMKFRQDVVVSLIMKSSDFLHQLKDGSVKVIEHHFSRQYYFLQGSAYKRNFFEKIAYRFRDLMVIHNLKKIDCFVVLTHEDANSWDKILSNVVVIPNSVTYKNELKADLKNKQVISIGRLDYQKGYDMLIPIWKKVSLIHPDWKLCIYGNGNLKSTLLNLINQYGLQDCVFIKEPVKDVEQILLESSIYLLPSRFEGLPMVLLESMSLGVPPIAFKCKCGPKDLIENGVNGFLVECFDKNDFANKIVNLIKEEDLRVRMGTKSKQLMIEYSHDFIYKKWEGLFMNLIAKRKGYA